VIQPKVIGGRGVYNESAIEYTYKFLVLKDERKNDFGDLGLGERII
jgi:hypothetical protein